VGLPLISFGQTETLSFQHASKTCIHKPACIPRLFVFAFETPLFLTLHPSSGTTILYLLPSISLLVLSGRFPLCPLFIASPPVFRGLRAIATTSTRFAMVNAADGRHRRKQHQSGRCLHRLISKNSSGIAELTFPQRFLHFT
jgi:hypothetical protein